MVFISGAYIPLSLLPRTLEVISYFNPLAYAVAFFRTLSLEKANLTNAELLAEELAIKIGNFVVTPMLSMIILLVFGLLFLTLSTMSFVRADFSKINRSKADLIEW